MNLRKGFTLIEILIVVAIIAILASVVLVGLGPTQQAGRDARRLSDIHEVQNGFELFFNKCGYYPGQLSTAGACTAGAPSPTTWAGVQAALTTYTSLGVLSVPVDPTSGKQYGDYYGGTNGGYVLSTHFENGSTQAFNGYQAPTTAGGTWTTDATAKDCTQSSADYCVTL